jgi:hypothetical protein
MAIHPPTSKRDETIKAVFRLITHLPCELNPSQTRSTAMPAIPELPARSLNYKINQPLLLLTPEAETMKPFWSLWQKAGAGCPDELWYEKCYRVRTMTQSFIWLTFTYTMIWWFAGHQTMHLQLVKTNATSLNRHLVFLMRITSLFTLYVLIWIAFSKPWHITLLMFIIGFLIRVTMIEIEKILGLKNNQTTVSLWGIVAIPLLTAVCIGLTA